MPLSFIQNYRRKITAKYTETIVVYLKLMKFSVIVFLSYLQIIVELRTIYDRYGEEVLKMGLFNEGSKKYIYKII